METLGIAAECFHLSYSVNFFLNNIITWKRKVQSTGSMPAIFCQVQKYETSTAIELSAKCTNLITRLK